MERSTSRPGGRSRRPSFTGSLSQVLTRADPLDLPYRTLTEDANFEEYVQETEEGVIPIRSVSRVSGKLEDFELVTFTIGDKENPKNWSKAYKWYCTMVVAFTCFVVAFNSAVITADLVGVSKTFHVSEEVSLLTITVFVVGFGVGKFITATTFWQGQ